MMSVAWPTSSATGSVSYEEGRSHGFDLVPGNQALQPTEGLALAFLGFCLTYNVLQDRWLIDRQRSLQRSR
jgi:hypothetical protein